MAKHCKAKYSCYAHFHYLLFYSQLKSLSFARLADEEREQDIKKDYSIYTSWQIIIIYFIQETVNLSLTSYVDINDFHDTFEYQKKTETQSR